jgi:hypothetical protein
MRVDLTTQTVCANVLDQIDALRMPPDGDGFTFHLNLDVAGGNKCVHISGKEWNHILDLAVESHKNRKATQDLTVDYK